MSGFTVKLIALIIALASFGSSAVLSFRLAGSVGANKLAYTDRAEENDPPQVAAGIAMGAFRGLFVNILWIRANDLKEQGKYFEAIELAKAITRLQPRFPRVWAFHAWNMAYNISVVTQTPEERWQWVQAGVRLLRDEGIPANPNEMLLYKELAWIYIHKIGGYTDDSNQYYKRRVAEEWQTILGEPPSAAMAESRTRQGMINLYAGWMDRIALAADTRAGLIARVPQAERLLAELQSRVGVAPGQELLRRYAFHMALAKSGRRAELQQSWGPKNQALAELIADPSYARAWEELIAHTRKRVIIDDYHMSPNTMARFTRRWGPLDWRHPAAHSLYWSQVGVERGENRVSEENQKAFDFVNTNRIIMQSLQELWRGGAIYFNYLDFTQDGDGFYMTTPNMYFVEAYGELYEQVVRLGGVFESREQRAMTPYAAGYENFLKDVVALYFRRGEIAEAEKWYEKLRNFEGLNINDQMVVLEYARPLAEFVQRNLWDRFDSPTLARQEVFGALQGAYAALLVGDLERFQGSWKYATDVHQYYFEKQYRPMVASGQSARMEYMPRDFRLYAGLVFADMFRLVPLDEAELLYFNAPNDLKQFAYDPIVEIYREPMRAQVAAGLQQRTFEQVFPEPDRMEQFRSDFARRRAAEQTFRESLNIDVK
ncbi:MAG: hypothetical protein KJZ65_04480 [Phycisphaerales bacterium]|nr:hypothetical protein [Phycisphaerales bacterium]